MICDEFCAPASNQMQLALDEPLMEEARQWVKEHPSEWRYFMYQAWEESVHGYASAKGICMDMRRKFKVKVNDKLTSSFARIAKEQNAKLKFKTKKSKVDGYTTAKL